MRRSKLVVLPLLVVAVLYGLVSPSPVVALGLGLLALPPTIIDARVTASRAAQIVIAIALFGGALTVLLTLLATNIAAPEILRTPWAAFAGATLLVAVTRNYFATPVGGDTATIGIALCALTGCGGAKTGLLYPAFVVLFLAAAALARRSADRGSAPPTALKQPRSLGRMAVMLGMGGAVATLFIVSLPPLHNWAVERIMLRMSARSGFSRRLWLGSMRGMLLSDRKVLRVHGENVDYLRGIVYSRYLGGRWSRTPDDDPRPKHPPENVTGGDLVEVRYVDSEPERYFLPLEIGEVGVSSGIALVDRHGIVAPVAAEPAYRIQYRRSGERPYPVAQPDAGDLEVPEVVWRLKRVAHQWTEDAETPEEIATAIMDHLQGDGFRYSLDFRYRNRRDPIVEFILDEREGHCEFYASAMAILLRLRGVPARLVGGYRVTEKNPIGDYYIVRERNAHAWVEAYLPGKGWTTFDPTPPADLAPEATTTSLLAGLVDAAGAGWASFLDWLDQRTWTEVLSVPAVVIVIPLLIRILLRRRSRGRREEEDVYAQSLPCFEQLTEALEHHGVIRGASETIEQLAGRVAEAGSDVARDGPELLRRYAAHRYGGRGDLERLEADIRAFCAELSTRTDPRLRS